MLSSDCFTTSVTIATEYQKLVHTLETTFSQYRNQTCTYYIHLYVGPELMAIVCKIDILISILEATFELLTNLQIIFRTI